MHVTNTTFSHAATCRSQGIVVEVDTLKRSFVVDDGTGTVTAILPPAGLEDDGADARNSGNADGLPQKGA